LLAQIEELQLEDFDEVTDLIDRCMRPGADLSMSEDFPLLVGRGALGRRFIIRSDGRIVSHVASRTAAVQLPNGRLLQCLNIGAVCTDPSAGGQGFASQLLEAQLRCAQEEGVELSMLWSEVDGFYERHGFERAGGEARFMVSQEDLEGIQPVPCRWMKIEDLPALLKLRAEDPCPLSRTSVDGHVLFTLPRSKTLVATQGLDVVAYLTIGKGLDFEGAICEWAGNIQDVVGLLPTLLECEGLNSTLILGPSWHDAYGQAFRKLGCPYESGDMGMFKILNQEALILAIDSPRFQIDPAGNSPSLECLIGGSQETLGRPILPFYVWGLDSM
jgi:predicted N-acetyltransferase YhbS